MFRDKAEDVRGNLGFAHQHKVKRRCHGLYLNHELEKNNHSPNEREFTRGIVNPTAKNAIEI